MRRGPRRIVKRMTVEHVVTLRHPLKLLAADALERTTLRIVAGPSTYRLGQLGNLRHASSAVVVPVPSELHRYEDFTLWIDFDEQPFADVLVPARLVDRSTSPATIAVGPIHVECDTPAVQVVAG